MTQIQFTGTREEFLAKAREMMTEEDIERAAKAIYAVLPNTTQTKIQTTTASPPHWEWAFLPDAWEDAPDRHSDCISQAVAGLRAALQTPHKANPK